MSQPTNQIVVAADAVGERFDRTLATALGCSVRVARRMIEEGEARLDGKRAAPGVHLRAGQTIATPPAPDRAAMAPVAEALPLTVVYVDDALVVLDKPAGLPCLPRVARETGTLANRVVARWPECATVGDDPREAGFVHRLDNDTSGLILIARTAAAWTAARGWSTAGLVAKHYLAIVEGIARAPFGEQQVIDRPLAHAGQRMKIADVDPDAQPAITHYTVLARGDGASLVEVELVRGRHHQVRAHFAEIGHPLVGDTLYGGKLTGVRAGHFLHASRVTLPIEASRPSPSPDGATKGEASRPSPSPDGAMKGEASQLVKQLDFRCEPPAEFAATLAQYSIERGEAGLE